MRLEGSGIDWITTDANGTRTLTSAVADGATAKGFLFDTDNTFSTSGSKLFIVANNGTEKFSVDYAGNTTTAGSLVLIDSYLKRLAVNSIAFANGGGTCGSVLASNYNCAGSTAGSITMRFNGNYQGVGTGKYIGFSSATDPNGSLDVSLFRSGTSTLQVGAGGASGNGYMNIGGLRIIGYTTTVLPPTTTEYPTDKDAGVHVDSNTGTVYFAYNDGGTIKTATLS